MAARKPDPLKPATLEEGWARLRDTIVRVQTIVEDSMKAEFSAKECSDNYTLAFNMCTMIANSSPKIYEKYREALANYCTGTILPDIRKYRGELLLQCLYRRWERYKTVVKVLNFIFSYLDRFYTLKDRYTVAKTAGTGPSSLKDMADQAFKTHVFDGIVTDVNGIILQYILREREGELVDRAMLRSAVEVFIVMGQSKLTLYERYFETAFLEDTTQYYQRLSAQWISSDSCPEYLAKCEARIEQEMERVTAYLDASTRSKLEAVLNRELIARHVTRLIEMENSGALALLHQHKTEDLARMYRMVHRLEDKDGILPMCRYMKDHIIQIGMDAVKDQGKVQAADVTPFVERLLAIQAKYTDLVTHAFQKNSHFEGALKEAFTEFINKQTDKNTTAQLIAVYVDEFVKEKAGQEDEANVDHRFDELLQLIHHIVERDVFQEFYRKQLAKRLLMATKLNEDVERNFVQKLKAKYGAAFTNRLEGMLTDYAVATELQERFTEYCREHEVQLDTSVQVLTQGYWPAYKAEEIVLPPEMTTAMQAFNTFYATQKRNRNLTWVHHLGTAVVNGKFSSRVGPVEISCTTFQAVVLILFNSGASLTPVEVANFTKLAPKEVNRILASLSAHKKTAVLVKNPPGEEIEETDQFSFNRDLPVKVRHIKIPGMTRLKDEEVATVKPSVLSDRKLVIESVIVRVMKSRKHLTHPELTAEVMESLKNFKPDGRMIKQSIEALISRAYLQRDEANQALYHYLA